MVADGVGDEARDRMIEAFRTTVATAVIGPVTSSALEDLGIPVWITPPRWHTGDLIRALAAWNQRRGDIPHAPPPLRLMPHASGVIAPDGRFIELGDRGYAVLAALARRPMVVCEVGTLLDEAWGHAAPTDVSAIKHQVARLRRKLDGTGVAIRTVRGVGYRLDGSSTR